MKVNKNPIIIYRVFKFLYKNYSFIKNYIQVIGMKKIDES